MAMAESHSTNGAQVVRGTGNIGSEKRRKP